MRQWSRPRVSSCYPRSVSIRNYVSWKIFRACLFLRVWPTFDVKRAFLREPTKDAWFVLTASLHLHWWFFSPSTARNRSDGQPSPLFCPSCFKPCHIKGLNSIRMVAIQTPAMKLEGRKKVQSFPRYFKRNVSRQSDLILQKTKKKFFKYLNKDHRAVRASVPSASVDYGHNYEAMILCMDCEAAHWNNSCFFEVWWLFFYFVLICSCHWICSRTNDAFMSGRWSLELMQWTLFKRNGPRLMGRNSIFQTHTVMKEVSGNLVLPATEKTIVQTAPLLHLHCFWERCGAPVLRACLDYTIGNLGQSPFFFHRSAFCRLETV